MKRWGIKAFILALCCALAVGMAACSDNGNCGMSYYYALPERIQATMKSPAREISGGVYELKVGDTAIVEYTALPILEEGREYEDNWAYILYQADFTSEDNGAISRNGSMVTGLKPGVATVTVTASYQDRETGKIPEYTAQIEVRVVEEFTDLEEVTDPQEVPFSLRYAPAPPIVGQEVQIHVDGLTPDQVQEGRWAIQYQPDPVGVNGSGVRQDGVMVFFKAGTAVVSFTYMNNTHSVQIECKEDVTLRMDPEALTMRVGEKAVLRPVLRTSSGAAYQGVTIGYWESRNTGVVQVDQQGNLSALGPGLTTVYYYLRNPSYPNKAGQYWRFCTAEITVLAQAASAAAAMPAPIITPGPTYTTTLRPTPTPSFEEEGEPYHPSVVIRPRVRPSPPRRPRLRVPQGPPRRPRQPSRPR